MENKKLNIIAPTFFIFITLAGWSFYFVGSEYFLGYMYRGELLGYLNDFAEGWRKRQERPSLAGFIREGKAQLFRYSLLGTLLSIFASLTVFFRIKNIRDLFWGTEESPYNIALFRIVLFSVLFSFSYESIEWFSGLPVQLKDPPIGLSPFLPFITTDASTAYVIWVLFKISCVFGILGVYTRLSALIALITGVYVLGIPQIYGKVNHYHHLFWFTALLIPSRSADVLSIDSLIQARRSSTVSSPSPARSYALPLRYVWILFGVIYFFPGFWKFVTEGFGWALSENMKYELHKKWFFRSVSPPLRLDQYPLLYKGAGLFTLLFEIGFIFFIPFRRLRSLGAGMAFVFHQATRLFLGIAFWRLVPFLLFLMDVRKGFVCAGRFVWPSRLKLVHDPEVSWQRFVVGGLLRMDLFDRLRTRSITERREGANDLVLSVSDSDREALVRNGRLKGLSLLRLIGYVPCALPFLPALPLVFLVSRARSSVSLPQTHSSVWISTVGLFLVAVNVLCGLGQVSSYPFAVYPTFAGKTDSTITTLLVEGRTRSGHTIDVLRGGQEHNETGSSASRFRGLLESTMKVEKEARRRKNLYALWSILRDQRSEFQSIVEVRFYRATYSTNPERSADPLLSTSLLTTIEVSPQLSRTD